MTLQQFLSKSLRLPRKLRQLFYIRWNRVVFAVNGVRFGRNMRVHNRFYLTKHPQAQCVIGDDFVFTSGESFNPLCRNIRGSILLPMAESVLRIGNDTGISSACLWAKESITIGSRVKIGGDCILMDTDAHSLDYRVRASHEMMGKHSKDTVTAASAPIVIEDDVLIGTRCIILKGVTVGARSIIGSGSVVTKSIPADCIAAGNPCRVIRSLAGNKATDRINSINKSLQIGGGKISVLPRVYRVGRAAA